MQLFDHRWEEIHQEQDWGKYPQEEVVRFAARNYYNRQRSEVKLLDAGCGTGAVAWFLAREGFDVSGFDGSETAIRKAGVRLGEEGYAADLRVADAAAMPYQDCLFDGIIDSAMISANRTEGIKMILKECYRVLKPGGKLLSTGLFKIGMTGFGTGEKLEENTYRQITEGPCAKRGTIHFFDRRQILDLWSFAGFRHIIIDSVSRTDLNGSVKIEYFMVESEK